MAIHRIFLLILFLLSLFWYDMAVIVRIFDCRLLSGYPYSLRITVLALTNSVWRPNSASWVTMQAVKTPFWIAYGPCAVAKYSRHSESSCRVYIVSRSFTKGIVGHTWAQGGQYPSTKRGGCCNGLTPPLRILLGLSTTSTPGLPTTCGAEAAMASGSRRKVEP